MNEDLKDAIQEFVDEQYEHHDGVRSQRVRMIQRVLAESEGIEVSRNEVQLACDELVEEDRLIFIKDSGKAGRRYCSTKADPGKVERLQESSESGSMEERE